MAMKILAKRTAQKNIFDTEESGQILKRLAVT